MQWRSPVRDDACMLAAFQWVHLRGAPAHRVPKQARMPRGGGCHLCRPLGAALQPRWRLSRPSPTTKASSWWVALLQGAAAAAGATRAAQAASRRHRERPNDAMWSQLRRTGCCGSWDGAPARVAAVQRWLLMPLRQIGLSSALHRCKATWRWSEGERMLCGLEEGAATCCRRLAQRLARTARPSRRILPCPAAHEHRYMSAN